MEYLHSRTADMETAWLQDNPATISNWYVSSQCRRCSFETIHVIAKYKQPIATLIDTSLARFKRIHTQNSKFAIFHMRISAEMLAVFFVVYMQ